MSNIKVSRFSPIFVNLNTNLMLLNTVQVLSNMIFVFRFTKMCENLETFIFDNDFSYGGRTGQNSSFVVSCQEMSFSLLKGIPNCIFHAGLPK